MQENKAHLTKSAVEGALLNGLYTEPDTNSLEAIQYQKSIPFFPENTWKYRIKSKLKKNRLIYKCWMKYKSVRNRGSVMRSFCVYIKRFLKKFRVLRFISNSIHMPWRIRKNNEMLSTLVEIATSTSQKCDATCWMIDDLRKRVDVLEEQINRRMDAVQSFLQIGICEKLDNENNEQRILLTGIHEKLDNENNEQRILLTGIHEKLDSANISLARTNSLLPDCKTVVSTCEAICVQYDWNLLVGVPASDWRLAMYLSCGGHFEYGTEKLFRETIKPDMNVLDIGANVGIYTLHALKCGACVYSFEPTPTTYSVLKQNTALNGFENSKKVHLVNAAVSDSMGVVRFAEIEGVCGQNNMFTIDETTSCIEVQTVKLDELLKDIQIDCFKLDVEGAEMLALSGMETLISSNPNIIGFIEFAPQNLTRAKVEPEALYKYLQYLGFTNIFTINEENGTLTKVTSYEDIRNEISINLYTTKGGTK